MRVVLLRHGATAGNEAHRYVGCRTDEPLSSLGMAQCARFGRDCGVAKVYVSPLLRARQTAQLCFPCATCTSVPGLEEFDFGAFEGRTAQEMERDAAYRAWVDSWCERPCPDGDTQADFALRTRAALDSLLRDAARLGEQQVVIVAHGGTIMAALDGFYSKSVGNCEGYVAEARLVAGHAHFSNEYRVRSVRDMAQALGVIAHVKDRGNNNDKHEDGENDS